MAVPWKTANKVILRSSYTPHRRLKKPTGGFVAPPGRRALSFTPTILFASMARVTALRKASAGTLSALHMGAAALAEAVVDDGGRSFDVTDDLLTIADAERTAFSGRLGAGICDVYMNELGYVWRDNAANQLKKGSGRFSDFVYDGGPASGHGVVLAEAKGSFALKTTSAAVKRQTEQGYTGQVQPYLGTRTIDGDRVVHGYGIGVGAKPGTPGAFLHVSETASPGTVASPSDISGGGRARVAGPDEDGSSGGNPGRGSTGGGTGSLGRGGGDAGDGTHFERVRARIALGNYRAVFELTGSRGVVSIIDAVLGAGTLEDDRKRLFTDYFVPISYAGGSYFSGMRNDTWPSWHTQAWGRFAIEGNVALAFLGHLRQLAMSELNPDVYIELPVVGSSLLLVERDADEPVVFRDGLSLFPNSPDAELDINSTPIVPVDFDRDQVYAPHPKWSYGERVVMWNLDQGLSWAPQPREHESDFTFDKSIASEHKGVFPEEEEEEQIVIHPTLEAGSE